MINRDCWNSLHQPPLSPNECIKCGTLADKPARTFGKQALLKGDAGLTNYNSAVEEALQKSFPAELRSLQTYAAFFPWFVVVVSGVVIKPGFCFLDRGKVELWVVLRTHSCQIWAVCRVQSSKGGESPCKRVKGIKNVSLLLDESVQALSGSYFFHVEAPTKKKSFPSDTLL